MDTLDIRPDPKGVYKQFSSVDVFSRYAFGDVRSSATAALARDFLGEFFSQSPFRVMAVQTDGGSEFYADFEQACIELGIQFFCLPPRSPKLNGSVERLNGTARDEFWAFYDGDGILEEMWPALKEWIQSEYNQSRPHQALGYLAPVEILRSLNVAGCLT
jgi:transposase InsO family protein